MDVVIVVGCCCGETMKMEDDTNEVDMDTLRFYDG